MRGLSRSIIALAAAVFACPADAKVLYHWVELGEGDSATIRAITDGACPNVVFDGVPSPMAARSGPGTRFQNVKPAAFDLSDEPADEHRPVLLSTGAWRNADAESPRLLAGDITATGGRPKFRECPDPRFRARWGFGNLPASPSRTQENSCVRDRRPALRYLPPQAA